MDMSETIDEYYDSLNRLVEEGDHKAVKRYIIEKKITPEMYYDDEFYPFFSDEDASLLAVKCDEVKVLKVLLEMGFCADDLETGVDKRELLESACSYGRINVVKMLVEEYGVDINVDKSLICLSAENGHIEVMQYLLERGISVKEKCSSGAALIHAARKGKVEACKFLLSKGADVNIRNQNKASYTALMFAAENAHFDVAQVLLEAGAIVNCYNGYGMAAFLIAAKEKKLGHDEILTFVWSRS